MTTGLIVACQRPRCQKSCRKSDSGTTALALFRCRGMGSRAQNPSRKRSESGHAAGRLKALPTPAKPIWRQGRAGGVPRKARVSIVPAAFLSLLVALDGMKCAAHYAPQRGNRRRFARIESPVFGTNKSGSNNVELHGRGASMDASSRRLAFAGEEGTKGASSPVRSKATRLAGPSLAVVPARLSTSPPRQPAPRPLRRKM